MEQWKEQEIGGAKIMGSSKMEERTRDQIGLELHFYEWGED